MSDNSRNKVGVVAATSYIVGTIIGSGIFVSPTAILTYAGSVGLSLIIWIVGGCIAMLTALVGFFHIRESGSEFAYISYVGWHPFAFAFLWSTTLITSSCSCAILVTTFGNYLIEALKAVYCFSESRKYYATKLSGFALLLLLSWTNFFSLRKYASKIQMIVASAKLLSFLPMTINLRNSRTENFTNGNLFSNSDYSATSIVLSVYGGVWAYSGYDVLNYGSEDIKNFKRISCLKRVSSKYLSISRTLPIAVVGGLLISTVIYLLTNIAYFVILTPKQMLESAAVATTFSKETLGNFYYAMPAIVAILMMGSINSDVFMFSRYMFAGARRRKMPTFLALINEEHESPRVAVVFHITVTKSINAIFAISFSFLGSTGDLINYMIVCGMLQQMFAVSALLWIKIRKIPVHPNAIKLPIILPILLLIVSASLVVIPIWRDWRAAAVGGGVVLLWLGIYFCFQWLYPIRILCWLNGILLIQSITFLINKPLTRFLLLYPLFQK
uniref:Amino Acid Transporter n=1 Tax=Syphacia muris TaxID=451379 RepID=A0A0N5AJM1_9BILA